MGLQLRDPYEVESLLKERLREGWLIIIGDPVIKGWLERQVYLPPYGNNDDFMLMMGMGSKGFFDICIGKKTNRLWAVLSEAFGQPDPPKVVRVSIQLLFFTQVDERQYRLRACVVKEGHAPEDALHDYLSMLDPDTFKPLHEKESFLVAV